MLFDLLSHSHYLGIVLVLLLSSFGLPIPEEVPVVMAGLLAANGTLDPWLAFLACLIGAITGDCLVYGIGYHFGRRVLMEHPRMTGFLTPERERQMETMIMRHGIKALFLARFMVGVRSPVYLTAGILRVPFRWFFLVDLFCATTVVGAFYWLSYIFGNRITGLLRNSQIGLTAIVVIIIAAVVLWYFMKRRRKKAALAREEAAAAGEKRVTAYEAGSNGQAHETRREDTAESYEAQQDRVS